jgi:cytoskeletal protein RodZ
MCHAVGKAVKAAGEVITPSSPVDRLHLPNVGHLLAFWRNSVDTIRPPRPEGVQKTQVDVRSFSRPDRQTSSSSRESSRSRRGASNTPSRPPFAGQTTTKSVSTPKGANPHVSNDDPEAPVARLGRTIVREVIHPTIDDALKQESELAGEASSSSVSALNSIRSSFASLADSDPKLAWKLVEGLLNGINKCVLSGCSLSLTELLFGF